MENPMTKLTFSSLLLAIALSLQPASLAAEDAPSTQPGATTEPTEKLEVTNFDALKAAVDKTVTVTGTVSRTAWSPSGSILFINFESVGRAGFTVVVPKANKDAISSYGEAAEQLQGKQVEITGKIVLYRDKPQIQIATADQIKITGGADATTKPAEPPAQ
jgi:DNA/RNA endonuclease YhcR with UshA esterase domain